MILEHYHFSMPNYWKWNSRKCTNSLPNALIAGSEQSKTTQQLMNAIIFWTFVYKNVNGELIKTTIALGYLINSYNERIVRAEIPFKPFEFDVNYGILLSPLH